MGSVLVVLVVVVWLILFVPLIVIGARRQRKASFIVRVCMWFVVGGGVGTLSAWTPRGPLRV